jgi:hypothetical protein
MVVCVFVACERDSLGQIDKETGRHRIGVSPVILEGRYPRSMGREIIVW